MAITKNEINLTAQQLIEDLNNGFTWLSKDDLGYGNIEIKYGANPQQIAAIRKHPDLKDVDTTVTIFNIIGLKTNENTTNTKESSTKRTDNPVEQPMVAVASQSTEMAATEAADIFANL